MDDLDEPLRRAIIAWKQNKSLLAFERLLDAAPDCRWLEEVVGTLCECRVDHQLADESVDLRHELDKRAEFFAIPADERGISRLIDSIYRAAKTDSRLKWLMDAEISELLNPNLDGPISIAILGEFSSGKSSLINSLIGTELLSVGMVPVTASVTRLYYADKPTCQAFYSNNETVVFGLDELRSKVDERMRLGDGTERAVEIRIGYPSEFLRNCEIIDTPGFNSGIALHDQSAASIVFQSDAVFWVFDATQTGKETEFQELNHIKRATQCYALLNKIDAIEYEPGALEGVISDLSKNAGELFQRVVPVSAKRMKNGATSSGRELLEKLFGSIRESAYQIKADSFQKRRAELARKELARRALFSEEQEKSRVYRARFDETLEPIALDWTDVLNQHLRDPSGFANRQLPIDGLEGILGAIFGLNECNLTDEEAVILLEILRAACRHFTLDYCTLTDEWHLLRQALFSKFTRQDSKDSNRLIALVIAEKFEEYCRKADAFLDSSDKLFRLLDKFPTETVSSQLEIWFSSSSFEGKSFQESLNAIELSYNVMGALSNIEKNLGRYDRSDEKLIKNVKSLYKNTGPLSFANRLIRGEFNGELKKIEDESSSFGALKKFAESVLSFVDSKPDLVITFKIPEPERSMILLARMWPLYLWESFYPLKNVLVENTSKICEFENSIEKLVALEEFKVPEGNEALESCPILPRTIKDIDVHVRSAASKFSVWADEFKLNSKKFTKSKWVLDVSAFCIGSIVVIVSVWAAWNYSNGWFEEPSHWISYGIKIVVSAVVLIASFIVAVLAGVITSDSFESRNKEKVNASYEKVKSKWKNEFLGSLHSSKILANSAKIEELGKRKRKERTDEFGLPYSDYRKKEEIKQQASRFAAFIESHANHGKS